MFKAKLLAPLTLICALAIAASAHGADDDVFLDEGNGDFDQMPIAPAQQPVAEQQEPAPPVPEQAPSEPVPMLAEEPATMPGMEQPSTEEAPVKKSSPKKEKKAKVARSEAPAPKKTKSASSGGGKFVVTKDACPMMRSPASTAETMLTVKPSKKIWVEQAEDGWVKGFNKAGEAGYISTDCVE
jgi:outer membrane biosynthesis protein TonB